VHNNPQAFAQERTIALQLIDAKHLDGISRQSMYKAMSLGTMTQP